MPNSKKQIPEYATAALVLSCGTVYYGKGIGAKKTVLGEICFNTGMTGYQETITDPSYAGQIITFTFPHIGNVGANNLDNESEVPHASGIIIREEITNSSNYRSESHLNNWLIKNNITGISGVDTRALTRHIRKNGAQNAVICYSSSKEKLDFDKLYAKVKAYPSLEGMELADKVSDKQSKNWKTTTWYPATNSYGENNNPEFNIVAVDYGAKYNIFRNLAGYGANVHVVPAKTSAKEILSYNPDGIFLSNGPGDPAATALYSTEILQELISKNIPIFGICLGHQLLAIASGCTTYKLHQGHRGANHPVQNLANGRVEITSQNHGFAVKNENLPANVEITHLSLFDNTVEGFKLKDKPVFSVQYHPESSPGPHDSVYLFEQFVEMIRTNKKHA